MRFARTVFFALLTVAIGSLCAAAIGPARAQSTAGRQPFTFAAIGDMPYELPNPPEKFDRLIEAVNKAAPAFTLHVGDIFSGATKCEDRFYTLVKERFGRFDNALIYTPGDNEWTDCYRMFGGGYDPLERLAFVRRTFFPDPGLSLGRNPLQLQSQSREMGGRFAPYVENRRFAKNGILFATVHVVGSNNNRLRRRPETLPTSWPEHDARNAANLAWIADCVRLAITSKATGLVFAWQANVHATPRLNRGAAYSSAFAGTIAAIERAAADFRKPILVISGDFHFFNVDAFRNMEKNPVPNVRRLQVDGEARVHGALVTVHPDALGNGSKMFEIKRLLVPGNGPDTPPVFK